ncbi:hypothetical protein [Ruminococcus gauvreauii]|uniref:hypothetical protein n=1 Tax=Ruminococcus gauvreauii TaxID=438033 RepID=UPI003984577A
MFKKTGKSNLLKRTAAAVCILAVGIGVFSVASILNNGEGGDSPEIDKVITKNYVSESEMPSAVSYTEYIDGAWWGGRLELQSQEQLSKSKLYQGTFSGTLQKQEM